MRRFSPAAMDIFGCADAKRALSVEEEARKRSIYDGLSARGKTYVAKIGYDAWDPFQEPKDPLDIRADITKRTAQQLVRKFLRERGPDDAGNAYGQGVLDCALGIVNKDERIKGMMEFCAWYERLLRREGYGGEK